LDYEVSVFETGGICECDDPTVCADKCDLCPRLDDIEWAQRQCDGGNSDPRCNNAALSYTKGWANAGDCFEQVLTRENDVATVCPAWATGDSPTCALPAKVCDFDTSASGCHKVNISPDPATETNEIDWFSNGTAKEWVFPTLKPATYVFRYKATDDSNNAAVKCRTVLNVDYRVPVCNVIGAETMTIEATNDGSYVDDGATCSDQVDGMISSNVRVSGDVVNLAEPGVYNVRYDCTDSSGNDNRGDGCQRVVHVEDTRCPTCEAAYTSLSELDIEHEASFPYQDPGSSCTDDLDGDLGSGIVWGNDDTSSSFVLGTPVVNVERVGTYKIKYIQTDVAGNVNEDMNTDIDPVCPLQDGIKYMRTVRVKDTMLPVITLTYRDQTINHTNSVFDTAMAESRGISSGGFAVGSFAAILTGVVLFYASTMQRNSEPEQIVHI